MDNARLNFEYQQKVKNYAPYEVANVQIINYNEIKVRAENKETKEKIFKTITARTKVKAIDEFVLVYNDDELKFFSSIDNLATGFIDESSYRDTLFFDHPNKIVFIARRQILPQKKIGHVEIINEQSVNGQGNNVQELKQYMNYQLNNVKNEIEKIEQTTEPKKKSRGKKRDALANKLDEMMKPNPRQLWEKPEQSE